MFGWTIRRTVTVERHVAACRRALEAVEQSWGALKPHVPVLPLSAVKRHDAALARMHRALADAAAETGLEVQPLTGGLPKPEDDA